MPCNGAAVGGLFASFIISFRRPLTADVRQRNQHRPAPATSTLTYAASCIGRVVCIARRHSAYPIASMPPRTYVASFRDEFKHHSRATSNAKHPTPEDSSYL